MKYIQYLAIPCLLLLAGACGDTAMMEAGQLTASFPEPELNLYENSGINRIGIELSAPAAYEQTVTVVVKTEINTRAGKDYLLENREIRIGKGERSGELELELIDDGVVNDSRSLILSVLPSSSVAAATVNGECRIQLLDDESDSSVEFSEGVKTVMENDGTLFLPFLLQGTPNGEVIVSVAVKPYTSGEPAVEGTHFTIPVKEFVFNPETNDPADFGVPVTLTDDDAINPDRSFVVEITRVYNAVRITEKSTCVVTIRSDELAVNWGIPAAAVEEHPEGRNRVQLPIRLQGGAVEDLVISLEIIGEHANDLSFVTELEVTLPLGEDSLLVDVTPVYDPLIVGDRNVQFRIKGVEGHDGLGGSLCDLTVYEYDTEVISDIPAYYAGSNLAVPIVMPFSLSRPVHHDVEIKLDGTSVGGEHMEFPASLIIPSGETAGTVSVPVYPDYAGQVFTLSAMPVAGVTQDYLQVAGTVDIREGAELDRSGWTIHSFSSEATNEGAANRVTALIDGNPATFWHSKWSSPPGQLPHWVILDLGEPVAVTGMKVQRRLSNGNTKTVEFSVSNDLSAWIPAGRLEFTATTSDNIRTWENTLYYNLIGRYVKINMPNTNKTGDASNPTSIAEFWVNGFPVPQP